MVVFPAVKTERTNLRQIKNEVDNNNHSLQFHSARDKIVYYFL